MELFVVNRFLGDDEHLQKTSPSQSILDKLHQKAAARKQRKSLSHSEQSDQSNKKRQIEILDREQEDLEGIRNVSTLNGDGRLDPQKREHSKREKKKKKCEREIKKEGDVKQENVSETEQNDSGKEARKKRRREKRTRRNSLKLVEVEDFIGEKIPKNEVNNDNVIKQIRVEEGVNERSPLRGEDLEAETNSHKRKKKRKSREEKFAKNLTRGEEADEEERVEEDKHRKKKKSRKTKSEERKDFKLEKEDEEGQRNKNRSDGDQEICDMEIDLVQIEETILHIKKKKKRQRDDEKVVKNLRGELDREAERDIEEDREEDNHENRKKRKWKEREMVEKEIGQMANEEEERSSEVAPRSPISSEKRKKKKKKKNKDKSIKDQETGSNDHTADNGVETETKGGTEVKGQNTEDMFPILGDFQHSRKDKVKRVLPEWLANPSLISRDIVKSSVDVTAIPGLDQRITDALKEMNIHKFFPVQYKVIPLVLQSVCNGIHIGPAGYRPRDICVSAPTGSGKTLAFVVPIVQALLDRTVQRFRVLVVLPTKDLATQIYKVFHSLCQGTSLKVVMVGGQRSVQQEEGLLVKQSSSREYQCGGDILVATPGRLIDHINSTKGFTLKYLRFLIVDEADRMMDQLSKDWITRVEKTVFTDGRTGGSDRPLPGPITIESESRMDMPLQKLLFSATLSQNPEILMHLNLFQPRLVTSVMSHDQPTTNEDSPNVKGDFIGKYTTPVSLEEFYVACSSGEKPLILVHMLKTLGFNQVLCFTNSVESTHRLYLLLELIGGINVAEFSSKLTGHQRQSIIKKFKNDNIQLLICSDAMARGMDLSNVKYVVSYDLPPYLKTYIHRVGRTARAGRKGVAYTILQHQEEAKFKSMMKAAGKETPEKVEVTERELDGFVEQYEKALKKLSVSLKGEIFQQRNR